jgi:hypothetical protein
VSHHSGIASADDDSRKNNFIFSQLTSVEKRLPPHGDIEGCWRVLLKKRKFMSSVNFINTRERTSSKQCQIEFETWGLQILTDVEVRLVAARVEFFVPMQE